MVEPCFNELTMIPYCSTEDEVEQRVDSFISTLNTLKQHGIKRVRYENGFSDIILKEGLSLEDYCNQAATGKRKNNRDFLYSFLKKPYLNEGEESVFNKYDDCVFLSEQDESINCLGLYVAFIMNSFAVGFENGIFKDNKNLNCHLCLTKNNQIFHARVVCMTRPEHLFDEEIIEILSNQDDLPVDKTIIPDEKKKIHISKHHGIKECLTHARELISSKYVTEILNSIDFDRSEKQYIHKITEPNLLEIRLYWTKGGYGLCVATTGKDIIQTKWIAKNLDKKFGNK